MGGTAQDEGIRQTTMYLGEEYEIRPVPPAPKEAETFWSRWKLTGPGWVMMAQEVGVGELVTGSYIGAVGRAGANWAVLLSAAVKIVNDYLHARYMLTFGEHPLRKYLQLFKGIPFWILLAHLIIGVVTAPALPGTFANTLQHLFGLTAVWPWYYVFVFIGSVILILLPLAFAPWVYKFIETASKVAYIILYLGLVIVAAYVSTVDTVVEFLYGFVRFGYIPAGLTLWTVLSWMGWGFGGDYNEPLRYPMWFAERGWGMTIYREEARRIPGLIVRESKKPTSGESSSTQGESSSILAERLIKGFIPNVWTPEGLKNYRLWLKVLQQDLFGIYLPLAFFGSIIFTYLAMCILNPLGKAPSGFAVVVAQADYFGVVWGPIGRTIFLILVILLLWPTIAGAWDGTSRWFAELILGYRDSIRRVANAIYIASIVILIASLATATINVLQFAVSFAALTIIWLTIYIATKYLKTFKSIYWAWILAGVIAVHVMMWAAAPLWFILLGSAMAVSLLPAGQFTILYCWLKAPKELRPHPVLLAWQGIALGFWIVFTVLSWLVLFGLIKL